MNQSTNYKIDFNDKTLIQQTQTIVEKRGKTIRCGECKKRRKTLDESHLICHVCYRIKAVDNYNRKRDNRQPNYTVVLKKLNNSKNITSKELNEVRNNNYLYLI